jgi:hypothetical protein
MAPSLRKLRKIGRILLVAILGCKGRAPECPPLALVEELHAATFLLDVDATPDEVAVHVNRARSLPGQNAWTGRALERIDAIVRARAEGGVDWKIREEELRADLSSSACLDPETHRQMHERLQLAHPGYRNPHR